MAETPTANASTQISSFLAWEEDTRKLADAAEVLTRRQKEVGDLARTALQNDTIAALYTRFDDARLDVTVAAIKYVPPRIVVPRTEDFPTDDISDIID